MKATVLFSAIILTLLCSRCDEEPANWRIDRQRIEELMTLSSETITLDGATFELHAYLWRDFMPISPPDGKELIALNQLINRDSVEVPGHLSLSQQFVIHGDSLWTADYTNETRRPQPYILERISRGGPKWGPEIEVTVIARVVDTRNGAEFYLRREHQPITRTE